MIQLIMDDPLSLITIPGKKNENVCKKEGNELQKVSNTVQFA